jgi:hypothetical protein
MCLNRCYITVNQLDPSDKVFSNFLFRMELPRFITHNIEILGVRELRFVLFCEL